MEADRQKAFLRLKPPCVELSSVALKFKTQQVPVKDVLCALEAVHKVLTELGNEGKLDTKLAEYAFFPLAQQVFNESQRLSPRCLEVAAECVTILVLEGYKQSLMPELGKQLIILMTMISGGGTKKDGGTLTDELRVAAFNCITAIVQTLGLSPSSKGVFDDQGTKNVVDQLTYLLLDSITESPSDKVQVAASEAICDLVKAISNRVFLASLLPRTVSSLTKALRPSTQSKRTQKVLAADLGTLKTILSKTIADQVALHPNLVEAESVGPSWLKATAAQVKNALAQVMKLRTYGGVAVQYALRDLCLMVIEECPSSLSECIPLALETLIILSNNTDGESTFQALRHLAVSRPEIADMLRESFFNWCQSLPRLMRGSDDRPKQLMLQRLTATLKLLSDTNVSTSDITDSLSSTLVDGVSAALHDTKPSAVEVGQDEDASFGSLIRPNNDDRRNFDEVILNHQSQKDSVQGLQTLLEAVRKSPADGQILQRLVNTVADASGEEKLSSLWLAIQLLKKDGSSSLDMNDILDFGSSDFASSSRDSLLDDLYAVTFPMIDARSNNESVDETDWRLVALSLESLVMNAERYPGDAYRPELINSLYPVLSFMGSPNSILRSYALTTLDRLARACRYTSTAEMLIDNADYLVNSVAWKLNTYSLSPEAPQILRMMVRLCGARLIPYLDDLIQSIFAALDNYHGYSEWVEVLFDTLKTMVDESVKAPQLAITQGKEEPLHSKNGLKVSTTSDILEDLRARKKRKLDFNRDASEPPSKAPHRAWTSALDGPTSPPSQAEGEASEEGNDNIPASKPEDKEDKLSKSHQLLLSIANATAPHFASPSPRVRRLLLDLISDISPLLGRDENTFLPFINAIWPVIVPRLLREQTQNEEDSETAYNCCAAADTISVLCRNAGDFMSSRIEEILPGVLKLFRKVYKDVAATKPKSGNAPATTSNSLGEDIKGAVNLQVVKAPLQSDALTASAKQQPTTQSATRTSSGQILNSLIDLMGTIIGYVRVSLDQGDGILRLLAPIMNQPRREAVRDAMNTYNADAVWLLELEQHEVDSPKMPSLRPELQEKGLSLIEISI